MKTCSKCKLNKHNNEFYKSCRTRDELQNSCKSCQHLRNISPNMTEYYSKRQQKRLERGYAKDEFEFHTERVLLREAKFRAKKQKREFNLEINDIQIPKYCPLLGIKITRIRKCTEIGDKKIRIQTNPSIDRIDSDRGYTKDNIWVISALANTMKNNATIDELIQFSKSILKKFNNGIDYYKNINDNNMHELSKCSNT